MRTFLLSTGRKIAYILAISIILMAFLMAAARFLSPVLNNHRTEFEKAASDAISQPVNIRKVGLTWYQYQPAVTLDDVVVLDKTSQKPILRVNKIHVFISIWKSLWYRKPIMNGVMISGTSLDLYQDADGNITLRGFPTVGSSEPDTTLQAKLTDAMNLIAKQKRLIFKDIDLLYTGFNGKKRYLTLYDLNFYNGRTNHYVVGSGILHQNVPTEVSVAIRWQGPKFDLETIKAKGYIYVSGLNLGEWAQDYTVKDWQVKNGFVSAKIWASYKHHQFQKIQTLLQGYNVELTSTQNKKAQRINRLSANLGWKRSEKDMIFAGNDILIDLPNHLWPVTSFYLELTPNETGTLVPKAANLGYIDLGDVRRFLLATKINIPDELRDALSKLNVKGSLENTILAMPDNSTDWQMATFKTKFNHISFDSWQNLPNAQNLSGNVEWSDGNGNLTLSSNNMSFMYASIFKKPLPFDNATGKINFKRDGNQNWTLTPNINVNNADLSANIAGSMTILADGTPISDITGSFTAAHAQHVPNYLPLKLFSEGLNQWLQTAILDGQIKDGKVILKGNLKDFPFKDNGTFLISGQLVNAQLCFAPDWPEVNNINGQIVFENRKMNISANNAMINDFPVKNVKAEIPYLGSEQAPKLLISADDIITDFTHGMDFVHKSPLEKSIGKMFAGINFTGPLNLKLNLDIPLSDPSGTKVNGSIQLKNTLMEMEAWGLTLKNLNGQVNFTENSTTADNINGLFFDKPLNLKLTTEKGINDTSIIEAQFNNKIAIQDLQNWLKIPFTDYVNGVANVQGKITFAKDTPMEIHLATDLTGVEVKLPDEYGKQAKEARNFVADIFAQENEPLRMKVIYSDLLSAALVFDKADRQFSLTSANVRLGPGVADWPKESGLFIAGDFDKLSSDQFKNFTGLKGSDGKLPKITLKGVDLRVNTLDLFAQTLTHVRMQIMPSENNYNINITSKEAVGQIQIPINFKPSEVITAQFQQINIPSSAKSMTESVSGYNPTFEISNLPSINFNANQLKYGDTDLGQVSFTTAPSAKGLTIRTLRITSPKINLQASGEWIQTQTSTITKLQGSAKSLRIGDLLSGFGVNGSNFLASFANLNFDLQWRGGPFAPDVDTLDGHASIELGKGRIVDVGQSTNAKMDFGRVLSIFSLQSLPRRLSLDFSDLFQKGYSFDSVKGDFRFENGNAYTTNLRFDGPVAGIKINGRIGFKSKDVNLVMSITPYVTSSIPLAATLLTGQPLIGLAALAVNTVVSQVTTYNYSVTGPLSNPSWQATSKQTQSGRLSAPPRSTAPAPAPTLLPLQKQMPTKSLN